MKDAQISKKLDIHIERIINIKEKYDISDNIDNKGINIKEINQRIDKINDIVKRSD